MRGALPACRPVPNPEPECAHESGASASLAELSVPVCTPALSLGAEVTGTGRAKGVPVTSSDLGLVPLRNVHVFATGPG